MEKVFFALALFSVLLWSQDDSTRTYIGEEVEVVAEREPWVRSDSVDLSVRVDASALGAIGGISPALFVTRRAILGYGVASGAAGKVTLLGLGGTPTTQITFAADGDPLVMGLMGHPVQDALSLGNAAVVELLEGASPVDFGAGAMGGVVVLKTPRPTQKGIDATAGAVAGDYETASLRTSILGRLSGIDFDAHASYSTTGGYRSDANDSYKAKRLGGHIGYRSGSNDLLVSASYDDVELYDPGTTIQPKEDAWYRLTRWHTHLGFRHGMGAATAQAAAFVHAGEHKIYDGFRSNDLTWGARASVELEVFGELCAKLSVVQMGGEAENIERGMDFGRHWATDYTASAWWRFSRGGFSAKLGAAAMYRRGYDVHIAPELGVSYRLGAFVPFLRVANGFRFPSLREIAVFPWSSSDLAPEECWTIQLGTRASAEAGGAAVEGRTEIWHTYAQNLIVDGFPGHPYRNSGEFSRTGASVEVRAQMDAFHLRFGYAFQELGERTSISPGHHVLGDFGVRANPGVPVEFAVAFEGAAEIYGDDNSQKRMPDFLVFDLRARCSPARWLSVAASVENVANVRYYTQWGYPMPPRTARLALSVGVR